MQKRNADEYKSASICVSGGKKMEKIVIAILIAVLSNPIILRCPSYPEEDFKDTSPEVKKTIKEFDKRGILKDFIGKYGEDYFRPTSTITREDLIMALREYDRIVKSLIEYRKMLSKKVRELSKEVKRLKDASKNPSSSTVDDEVVNKVIDETQKVLPMLIENAPMPKKVEEELISMREEISILQEPSVNLTNDMIKKVIRESYPQIEKEAENQKEIEHKISKLQNKLNLLTRRYNKASKSSNYKSTAIDEDIIEKIDELERNMKSLESKVASSKRGSGTTITKFDKTALTESDGQKKIRKEIATLKKEINKWAKIYQDLQTNEGTNHNSPVTDRELRRKIDRLERNVKSLESKVASSKRNPGSRTTKRTTIGSMDNESKKNSALTKISLGISLLALLFMVR